MWWVILCLIHVGIAIWIYYDAKKRGYNKDGREEWAFIGLFFGLLALLCWFLERKSKEDMLKKYKMDKIKKEKFKKSIIGKIYYKTLDISNKTLNVTSKILKIIGILILIIIIVGVGLFGGLFDTLLTSSGGYTTQCSGGSVYCNGECWQPCPVGYEFYCPSEGNARCLLRENPSETQTSEFANYDVTSYVNTEPYYSLYCNKIDPYDLEVRKASSDAVRKHPGEYNLDQLLDIYDWVKQNIIYLSVASNLRATPYHPSETLTTRSGDCKNQAVLISSMIESIGGTAKVIIDPTCSHAYSIVYFARPGTDMDDYTKSISYHYNQKLSAIRYFIDDDGIWVIFDPAGGVYPGETLSECKGNREIYTVSSCVRPS